MRVFTLALKKISGTKTPPLGHRLAVRKTGPLGALFWCHLFFWVLHWSQDLVNWSLWAWSWEDGRTILPTSHSGMTTNFNKFFLFPFSSSQCTPVPQLHILTQVWSWEDGRTRKRKRKEVKKLLKFVARPKCEVGRIVLPSSPLPNFTLVWSLVNCTQLVT